MTGRRRLTRGATLVIGGPWSTWSCGVESACAGTGLPLFLSDSALACSFRASILQTKEFLTREMFYLLDGANGQTGILNEQGSSKEAKNEWRGVLPKLTMRTAHSYSANFTKSRCCTVASKIQGNATADIEQVPSTSLTLEEPCVPCPYAIIIRLFVNTSLLS